MKLPVTINMNTTQQTQERETLKRNSAIGPLSDQEEKPRSGSNTQGWDKSAQMENGKICMTNDLTLDENDDDLKRVLSLIMESGQKTKNYYTLTTIDDSEWGCELSAPQNFYENMTQQTKQRETPKGNSANGLQFDHEVKQRSSGNAQGWEQSTPKQNGKTHDKTEQDETIFEQFYHTDNDVTLVDMTCAYRKYQKELYQTEIKHNREKLADYHAASLLPSQPENFTLKEDLKFVAQQKNLQKEMQAPSWMQTCTLSQLKRFTDRKQKKTAKPSRAWIKHEREADKRKTLSYARSRDLKNLLPETEGNSLSANNVSDGLRLLLDEVSNDSEIGKMSWALATREIMLKKLEKLEPMSGEVFICYNIIDYCDNIINLPETQALGFEAIGPLLRTILDSTRNQADNIYKVISTLWAKIWTFVTGLSTGLLRTGRGMFKAGQFLMNGEFYHTVIMVVIWLVLVSIQQTTIANICLGLYLLMQGGEISNTVGSVLFTAGISCGLANLYRLAVGQKITMNVSMPNIQALDMDLVLNNSTQSIIAIVIMLCTSLFCIKASDILPSNYTEFARTMNAHAQVARGFQSVSDLFSGIIEKGVKLFCHYYYGFDEEGTASMPSDVQYMITQVREYCGADFRNTLADNQSKLLKVFEDYTTYVDMRQKYRGNYVLTRVLDKLQGPMVNIYALANSYNKQPVISRVEPVVVMLKGESGVGKSSLLYHIASEILAHDGSITEEMNDEEIHERINSCIYPRASENEYWDGYQKNPVTMVDDAFQVRDSTTNPNIDYMELIRMSNPFPYPLHMAELSAKSNTNFTSRCVLYTTNVNKLNPESLISQEAVCRRVTLPYQVFIKAPYADATGRLRQEFRTGNIDLNVYEFRYWNPQTGIVAHRAISYEQFAERLRAKLDEHKFKFSNTKMNLVRHARNAINIRVRRLNGEEVGIEEIEREEIPETQAWPFTRRGISVDHPRAIELFNNSLEQWIQAIRDPTFEENRDIHSITLQAMCERDFDNYMHWDEQSAITMAQRVRYDFIASYRIEDEVNNSIWQVGSELTNFVSEWCAERSQYFEYLGYFLIFMYFAVLALATYQTISDLMKEEVKWQSKIPLISTYHNIDSIRQIYDLTRPLNGKEMRQIEEYITWLHNEAQVEGTDQMRQSIPVNPDIVVNESGKERKYLPKIKIESGKDRKYATNIKVEDAHEVEAWQNENSRQVAAAVRSNQVNIKAYVNSTLMLERIQGFFVVGRKMLLNFHYTEMFDTLSEQGQVILEFCPAGSTKGTKIEWLNIRKTAQILKRNGEDTDIVIVTIDEVDRRPNLLKHIIRRDQLRTLMERRIVLSSQEHEAWHLKFGTVEKVETTLYNSTNGVRSAYAIGTNISSIKGDCGGVYLLDDAQSARKICGFHFAGGSGKAFASPLVYEDFEALEETPIGLEKIPVYTPTVQGNVTILGTTPSCVYNQTNSKIMKTKMYNQVLESNMAPAKLSYKLGEGTILSKAMEKNFGSQEIVDPEILEKAVHDYEEMLALIPTKPMSKLTYEEAVQGIENNEYIRGVERSTSAGYPFAQTTKKKGKTEWFGSEEWTLESARSLELKQQTEKQIEHMEKDGFVEYIFMDTLKDETRTIEKVKEGKTRLFAAAPLDFLIVYRMYFMSFLAWMMENRIDNESAVGIRAHTLEWNSLARKLLSCGSQVIAGDFSNYDGTLHHRILRRILPLIEKYYEASLDYDPRDAKVRKILWENVMNSTHICGNLIYRLNHSQPSGNPATAILNSIYNSIACRYTWYASGHEDSFTKHVSMIAYGDDNVLSMSAQVGETFNQEVMTREFQKIGMTYTDELKSGNSGFRNISEVQFIKRRFVKEQSIWYSKLDLNSILECFNWIHKTPQEMETIKGNFRMANIEFATYTDSEFNTWMKLLQQAIYRTYNYLLPIISRKQIRMDIRDPEFSKQMVNWV